MIIALPQRVDTFRQIVPIGQTGERIMSGSNLDLRVAEPVAQRMEISASAVAFKIVIACQREVGRGRERRYRNECDRAGQMTADDDSSSVTGEDRARHDDGVAEWQALHGVCEQYDQHDEILVVAGVDG